MLRYWTGLMGGTVQLGGEIRRGLLDMNGEGEAVGGIIVMRYGENAKDVIDRVKEKIDALSKGLPPGVTIMPSYDRSDLIERAIHTLKRANAEVSVVCRGPEPVSEGRLAWS